MAQTMVPKEWNCFAKTGKVADYLCYRETQEANIFAALRREDELRGKLRQKDEREQSDKTTWEVPGK